MLALTEIKETWDASDSSEDDDYEDDDDYDYYADEEEDDEDDEDDDSRYQLNDLIDSSIRLTWWTDPDGASGEDISLGVADAEVCTATPSQQLQPYSSEYEGYMGNYGNTLDRWYRRAAVLVWPQDRRFTNRAQASPSWASDDLSAQARDQGPAAAQAAAATMAPFWAAAVRTEQRPGPLLAKTLPAALALDDADTASMLLRPFAAEDLSARHMAALAELTGRYGERWTSELLRAWLADRPAYRPVKGPSREHWLTMLPALCDAARAAGHPGTSTAHRLLEQAWDALAALIDSAAASSSATSRSRLLTDLGKPLAALIVGHCLQDGDELTPCVVGALRALPETLPGTGSSSGAQPDDALAEPAAELAADQAARLRAGLARPARAADDWSIQAPGGCSCDLCRTLGSFLADPARRTFEWRLATAGRSHVHARIDGAELPVTHQTRRQGSPYTLVLTKTAHLFRREEQQRTQNRTDLDWLDRWLSSHGPTRS